MFVILLLLAVALANDAICLTAKRNAKFVDLSKMTPELTGVDTGAGCSNKSNNEIECCACLDDLLGFIDLDGCADIELDWDTLDVTFRLTFNGTVLFESTFGFDSAPELCTDIWGIHICASFEDISLQNWTFEGCLHITIDYKLDINMGCWSLSKE